MGTVSAPHLPNLEVVGMSASAGVVQVGQQNLVSLVIGCGGIQNTLVFPPDAARYIAKLLQEKAMECATKIIAPPSALAQN
jgi:hypothetical protein